MTKEKKIDLSRYKLYLKDLNMGKRQPKKKANSK